MAVRLRLMRMGKKKQPTYRIVAADRRSPRDGRFLEIVGTYQPRLEPSGVKIDEAKALKWLRNGALPSETVEKLLKINGTWDHFTKGTNPEIVEEPAAVEPAAEEPPAAEPAAEEAAEAGASS
ncbi:MAG: 30S ribosomal protein S16 [Actinomycetia bacterium]|nr:30S ribosomal protein S16 [Actinomycetes bacterium]